MVVLEGFCVQAVGCCTYRVSVLENLYCTQSEKIDFYRFRQSCTLYVHVHVVCIHMYDSKNLRKVYLSDGTTVQTLHSVMGAERKTPDYSPCVYACTHTENSIHPVVLGGPNRKLYYLGVKRNIQQVFGARWLLALIPVHTRLVCMYDVCTCVQCILVHVHVHV